MKPAMKAQEPFRFYTRLHLSELTGLKSSTLEELLERLKDVSGSCIYYHTHRFLQQHQFLSPEPPNDFAYWAATALGEEKLAERLSSIDTIQYPTIRALREKIVAVVQDYLKDHPAACRKFADEGEEFHFIKSVSFILPTHFEARTLKEFADILGKVTIDSIYYHIFEARLRLERGMNDFSNWIQNSLGDSQTAGAISRLDPYTYSMEDLRKKIIQIVKTGRTAYASSR